MSINISDHVNSSTGTKSKYIHVQQLICSSRVTGSSNLTIAVDITTWKFFRSIQSSLAALGRLMVPLSFAVLALQLVHLFIHCGPKFQSFHSYGSTPLLCNVCLLDFSGLLWCLSLCCSCTTHGEGAHLSSWIYADHFDHSELRQLHCSKGITSCIGLRLDCYNSCYLSVCI